MRTYASRKVNNLSLRVDEWDEDAGAGIEALDLDRLVERSRVTESVLAVARLYRESTLAIVVSVR
jgi:hypothetical protein